jgi:hypothetical protein
MFLTLLRRQGPYVGWTCPNKGNLALLGNQTSNDYANEPPALAGPVQATCNTPAYAITRDFLLKFLAVGLVKRRL